MLAGCTGAGEGGGGGDGGGRGEGVLVRGVVDYLFDGGLV